MNKLAKTVRDSAPLSATIHRILVELGTLCAGLAVLPTAFDVDIVGVPPRTFAYFALGSLVLPMFASFWRRVSDPRASPP